MALIAEYRIIQARVVSVDVRVWFLCRLVSRITFRRRSRRPPLAWAASGVPNRCLVRRAACCAPRWAIPVAKHRIRCTAICKSSGFSTQTVWKSFNTELVGIFWDLIFVYSGDHTEAIAIDFDPTVVSYHQLLALFWNNHEYGLTTRIKRQVKTHRK